MISTKKNNLFRVFKFEPEKESDNLDAIVSSVYIVPQEHIFLVWGVSIFLKDVQEVVKLPQLINVYPWISPTTTAGDSTISTFG